MAYLLKLWRISEGRVIHRAKFAAVCIEQGSSERAGYVIRR
jgi:hypothetical protein